MKLTKYTGVFFYNDIINGRGNVYYARFRVNNREYRRLIGFQFQKDGITAKKAANIRRQMIIEHKRELIV